MTGAEGTHDELSSAALLHEVNERIREMAAGFTSSAGDELPQEYLCECGCGGRVSLSAREFDGVSAERLPVVVEGHVVARARAARQRSRALREDAAALRQMRDELKERIEKPAKTDRQTDRQVARPQMLQRA